MTEMRTADFHNREKVNPRNPYSIILQFPSMRIGWLGTVKLLIRTQRL